MTPAMKTATRPRGTSSFTWSGGDLPASKREPLSSQSRWPDFESSNAGSNETSADDFSDAATDYDNDRQQQREFRGIPVKASYESDLSDVGECDDRRRFRNSLVKMNYDSDSCLTPRSRRTLRRTLSGSTEPWPSAKPPSKAPALDTIFSPTHEILHPLQSLRLERSLSRKNTDVGCEFPSKVCRTSVTFESFIPKSPSQSNSATTSPPLEPSQSNSRSNSARFNFSEPSQSNARSNSARFKLPKPPQSDSESTAAGFKLLEPAQSNSGSTSARFKLLEPSQSNSRSNSARFKLPEPSQSDLRSNSTRYKLQESSLSNPGSNSARLKLPEPPQSDSATIDRSPTSLSKSKPKSTPEKFDSYSFPRNSVEHDNYSFQNLQSSVTITVEEEELEQKQSLIQGDSDGVDVTPLSAVAKEEIRAPNVVVIIVDAEKKLTFVALDWAINVAVRPGDEIVILGVLKHIFSPMGCKMVANTDPLYGVNKDFLQLEVTKTTESFESKVLESGRREECEKKQVKLSVRMAPGSRVRTVVVHELRALGATYAIFDRKAMRSRRYYAKHLSCHAVRMRRNGRSTKTITLVPPKPSSSDVSSVSSMSTDRTTTGSESSSSRSSPTFWRRLTNFRSSRRRSSISSFAASPRSSSPVSVSQEFPDLDQDLSSSKVNSLQLFPIPTDERPYACKGMSSHQQSLAAISITVPSAICAS